MSGADLLNDLNSIMRCVKRREQLHLNLVDYIKKMLTGNKDEISFFIDQQIRMHRTFETDLRTKHHSLKQQENETKEKYEFNNYFENSDLKLINRLCMRIMEICQACYEKLKQHFQFYDTGYKNFNDDLSKMLQNEKIDLMELLDIILGYSYKKFEQDLTELTKLIQAYEGGERDREYIKKVHEQRLIKKVDKTNPEKIRNNHIAEIELIHKKEKQKIEEKISKMREQAKSIQKAKKKKSKFIEKVYNNIYGVLDPSKQQMLQDMVYIKQDDQFKRLYTQIFQKNKVAHFQILAFSAKSEDFKQKVKKFRQLMMAKPPRVTPRKKSRQRVESSNQMETKKPFETPNVFIKEAINELQINQGAVVSGKSILNDLKQHFQGNSQRVTRFEEQYCFAMTTASEKEIPSSRKIERKSLDTVMDTSSTCPKKSSKTYLPQININMTERRERYDSVIINKAKRFSQPKNQIQMQESQQFKPELKMMPIANIQLNMQNKFDFKVQQFKKKEVSKAFEYTFYMKKKNPQQQKFYDTKNNFVVL